MCLSDINEHIGKKTQDELKERFGDESVHFIRLPLSENNFSLELKEFDPDVMSQNRTNW